MSLSATSTTRYGTLSVKMKAINSSFSKPSISFRNYERNCPISEKFNRRTSNEFAVLCCSNSVNSTSSSVQELGQIPMGTSPMMNPPVMKKRKRYRKLYPGESKGITEEMRFVAMRLRNIKGKYINKSGHEALDSSSDNDDDDDAENKERDEGDGVLSDSGGEDDGDEGTWEPSIDGFLKYLVDSKLVFSAVESIVDKSDDVSYAYFRKTGLERSEGLARDLEWFSQQNNLIPEPSNPGILYAKYLEELAEKSAPLFLSHFYNIYFSHIAGGQVIAKQVSERLLEGRELKFYRWEGDVEELLKGVREKLNMLGEHWSRDEKNKCLREATKSFRYMGQIVRLIIL